MIEKHAELDKELSLCLKKIRGLTVALEEFGREWEEIIEGGCEEAFIDLENANALLDETIALWGEDVKKRLEEYVECDETRHWLIIEVNLAGEGGLVKGKVIKLARKREEEDGITRTTKKQKGKSIRFTRKQKKELKDFENDLNLCLIQIKRMQKNLAELEELEHFFRESSGQRTLRR